MDVVGAWVGRFAGVRGRIRVCYFCLLTLRAGVGCGAVVGAAGCGWRFMWPPGVRRPAVGALGWRASAGGDGRSAVWWFSAQAARLVAASASLSACTGSSSSSSGAPPSSTLARFDAPWLGWNSSTWISVRVILMPSRS